MKFERKYSDTDVALWAKRYIETKSISKVGKEFGVSRSTVWYNIKQCGIKISKSRYFFDEEFFSRDTPESFYWAGFIAADGCLKRRKKFVSEELSIAIKSSDEERLCEFKKAVCFNGPISRERHTPPGYTKVCELSRITLTITNTKYMDGLRRFGITPRKSHTYFVPKQIIDHKLINHFLRGYFDGDGSFFNIKSSPKKVILNLCGTRDFLDEVMTVFIDKCNVKRNGIYKHTKSNKIFYISYGGQRDVIKIRDFLYKDSAKETRLERKFNKAFEI